MPITTTLCIIGAASISAFPLFSGFVSKSMVMAAAAQEGHTIVFLLLLFASAGVFHHAGIKIPYFAFFAHDSGIRTQEPPLNMLAAMGIAAALCIFNGVYPWALYSILPWDVAYQPYTWSHVISQTQLLFFSALAFALLMISGLYPPELRSVNLDVDWLYRKVGFNLGKSLQRTLAAFWNTSTSSLQKILNGLIKQTKLLAMPNGVLAKTWSTGTGTSWMLIILAISLLILFFSIKFFSTSIHFRNALSNSSENSHSSLHLRENSSRRLHHKSIAFSLKFVLTSVWLIVRQSKQLQRILLFPLMCSSVLIPSIFTKE